MHDIVREGGVRSTQEGAATTELSADRSGQAMHEFIADLYPICRSITGEGVRETLRHIQKYVPLTLVRCRPV